MKTVNPTHLLAHHVTGAIARGEAVPIVAIPAHPSKSPGFTDSAPEYDSAYLAEHKRQNPHNWLARVPGFPALSPHYVTKRDAEAEGRAAPFGAPCPYKPGCAYATWWLIGNGPARDC